MSRRVVVALLLVCALPLFCLAQTQTAQITGKLIDQTGSVVPGASVTVTSNSTGLKQTAESNDLGNYSVPLLQPGVYRITVQKTGFKPLASSNVELQVAQVARLDFTLEVGSL